MRIHHIGYLVKKIDKAIIEFENIGYALTKDIIFDEYRKVNICFLEKDDYVIELVSPATSDSLVSALIKKYKNSPYHICYSTDNFNKDLEHLTLNGYTQIDEPCAAPAIDGKNVVFLINPTIGIIELLEE